jgi:hypothetical protein
MRVDADNPRIEEIKRYVWRHFPEVSSPSSCSPTIDDVAAELPPDVRDRFSRHVAEFDDPNSDSLSSEDAAIVMAVHNRLETKNFIEMIRGHDLNIARCPRCGHVVASPFAEQCLACGHNWRGSAAKENDDRTKR